MCLCVLLVAIVWHVIVCEYITYHLYLCKYCAVMDILTSQFVSYNITTQKIKLNESKNPLINLCNLIYFYFFTSEFPVNYDCFLKEKLSQVLNFHHSFVTFFLPYRSDYP